MKYQGKLTVLAGCVALLVGAAHAQSPARDSARDTDQAAASGEYSASLRHRDYLQGADLRASQIVGAPVKNMEGETLGDIEELVIGEGNRMMVVLGVGGFLGVGEKRVAVPYDELRVSPDGDTFYVNRTRDALQSEPTYAYRERSAADAQLAQRAQSDADRSQASESQAERAQEQRQAAAQQREQQEQRAEQQRERAEQQREQQQQAAEQQQQRAEQQREQQQQAAEQQQQRAAQQQQRAEQQRETAVGAAAAAAAAAATLGRDDHRASAIIGATVVDSGGQDVGKIDDLVVSSETGEIQAVLSIGGVAGIGDKLVAVPFDDLQIAPSGESASEAPRLRLDMSAQQARDSLPEFRYERQVAQGSATSPRG